MTLFSFFNINAIRKGHTGIHLKGDSRMIQSVINICIYLQNVNSADVIIHNGKYVLKLPHVIIIPDKTI